MFFVTLIFWFHSFPGWSINKIFHTINHLGNQNPVLISLWNQTNYHQKFIMKISRLTFNAYAANSCLIDSLNTFTWILIAFIYSVYAIISYNKKLNQQRMKKLFKLFICLLEILFKVFCLISLRFFFWQFNKIPRCS
jgi:hypothetical protein